MKGIIKDPKEFIKKLDLLEVPNVVKISKKCGIRIFQDKEKKEMDYAGYNGHFIKKNNRFEIAINIELPYNFQRFLVAYLTSYIYLYGDIKDAYLICYETLYDRAAYNYALDLLLPDSMFKTEYLETLSYEEIEELAQHYKVSISLIFEKMEKNKKINKFKVLQMKEERK